MPSQLVGLGLPLGSTEAELEAKLEQDRQAQAAAEAKELAEVRQSTMFLLLFSKPNDDLISQDRLGTKRREDFVG